MINIFPLIIKLEKLNLSAQALCDRLTASFLSCEYNRCLRCKRRHMKKFCSYERKVSDYRNGKIEDITLKTNRYICECGSSHVLLPSIIIPYRRNSFTLIIHALYDYYSSSMSVERICEKYRISIPTLYRWKKCFEKDKTICLKILKDAETSSYDFIKKILTGYDFRNFMSEFMKENPDRRMFLESDKTAHSSRDALTYRFSS